jgi:hypothetical protein
MNFQAGSRVLQVFAIASLIGGGSVASAQQRAGAGS